VKEESKPDGIGKEESKAEDPPPRSVSVSAGSSHRGRQTTAGDDDDEEDDRIPPGRGHVGHSDNRIPVKIFEIAELLSRMLADLEAVSRSCGRHDLRFRFHERSFGAAQYAVLPLLLGGPWSQLARIVHDTQFPEQMGGVIFAAIDEWFRENCHSYQLPSPAAVGGGPVELAPRAGPGQAAIDAIQLTARNAAFAAADAAAVAEGGAAIGPAVTTGPGIGSNIHAPSAIAERKRLRLVEERQFEIRNALPLPPSMLERQRQEMARAEGHARKMARREETQRLTAQRRLVTAALARGAVRDAEFDSEQFPEYTRPPRMSDPSCVPLQQLGGYINRLIRKRFTGSSHLWTGLIVEQVSEAGYWEVYFHEDGTTVFLDEWDVLRYLVAEDSFADLVDREWLRLQKQKMMRKTAKRKRKR
jgi:hypothetical protein